MNFKKIVTVLSLLLLSDLVFTGCSESSHGVYSCVAPTAEELKIASQGEISPYDQIMRQVALQEGIDWRLLSAMAYQESRFDPEARSYRGAQGLMQIMGSVAHDLGVPDDQIYDPMTNVTTAARLIKRIQSTLRFGDNTSEEDKIKIVLACYNAGIGHVLDARRLAAKHKVNYNSWAQLREYVTLKGTPEWVNDEAVRCGAFNGSETIHYVSKVMTQYSAYCEKYT